MDRISKRILSLLANGNAVSVPQLIQELRNERFEEAEIRSAIWDLVNSAKIRLDGERKVVINEIEPTPA